MTVSKSDQVISSAEPGEATDRSSSTGKDQASADSSHPEKRPEQIEDGRMVLLARDPTWLYIYWSLTAEQHHRLWGEPRVILRIVELREHHIPREVKQIPLTQGAMSWYFQVDLPNRIYRAELGYLDAQGEFKCFLAANPANTSSAAIAEQDELVLATYRPGQPPEKT